MLFKVLEVNKDIVLRNSYHGAYRQGIIRGVPPSSPSSDRTVYKLRDSSMNFHGGRGVIAKRIEICWKSRSEAKKGQGHQCQNQSEVFPTVLVVNGVEGS